MPPHRLTHGSVPLPRPRRFQVGQREVRRKRANLAALRLRLGQKSPYILLALILFLMFTPYSVVLFMDDKEQWLTRDLARNPEALQVIFFLILCKMTAFGLIFASLPAISHWFLGEEEPPPPPPDKVTYKPYALSAAQRTLLTQGVVLRGQVQQVRWPSVTVRYLDTQGQEHSARLRAHHSEQLQPPQEGDVLTLLYDPEHPSEVVAPSLLDVSFEEDPDREDQRPQSLPAPAPVQDHGMAPRSMALKATLRPVRTPLLVSLRHNLLRSGRGSTQLGLLTVTPGHSLTQHHHDQEVQRIHLDQPFTLHMTVWLAAAGRTELNLSLHQGGAQIRLRTELDQRAVHRSIPTQQSDAPWLDPTDFAALWPVLRFHAAATGRDPGPLLALEQNAEEQVQETEPARAARKI